MSLRTSHKLAAFSFVALIASGCASENDPTADLGAGSGQGADRGGGKGAPFACSSVPGDHAAACPAGAPCAIAIDREITCDDDSFANVSLNVATTPAASFVGVASDHVTRGGVSGLLEVSADDAAVVPGFPFTTSHTPLLLATDPAGRLAAVTLDWTLGPTAGVAFALANDGGFTQETLEGARTGELRDVAFDAQGVAHVFYDGSGLSRRAATGEWSHGTTPGFVSGDRFALAADGSPVGLATGGAQVTLAFENGYKPLGSPVSQVAAPSVRVRPLGAPQPQAGAAPAFGAIIQHASGLRVAWPTAAGFDERVIEGSATPAYSCPRGVDYDAPNPPCRAACEERAGGLEFQAFAGAFGAGGEAWIAYVDSRVDLTIGYAARNFDGYELCDGDITRDDSTSELRLVRVPTDGAPVQQVLSLPLEKLDHDESPSAKTDVGPVSVHMFGDALTIGVRVLDAANRPKVRVLRVDTATLRGQLSLRLGRRGTLSADRGALGRWRERS